MELSRRDFLKASGAGVGGIFLLRGLAPDIPVGAMYRGVLPFVLSTLAVVILIFFFPVLVTWLPNIMMG